MTNNMYSPARRLLACLLALLCLLSIGAAGGLHAWADETEETGSTTEAAASGQRVDPVNLGANCNLKVYPISSGSDYAEDLKTKASMIVDVYKVAEAVAVAGVDMYGYQFIAPFNTDALLAAAAAGMDLREDGAYIPNEKLTNEMWSSISQEAAKIVKGNSSIAPAASSAKAAGEEYASVPAVETAFLPTGLYLLVVHTDASGYWNEEKTGEPLTTKVSSDLYLYSYAPQIVTLPYKSAQMQPYVDGSPVKTSDNTPWAYALSVYLKADRQARNADLYIGKTLQKYTGNSSMIFVYHVDAFDSAGIKVYSKAYSIELTTNGSKFTLAKGIPIGTTVIVSEDYPGAACIPVGPTSYTGTMTAEGLLTSDGSLYGDSEENPLPFVNEGHGNNGGGGIENTFQFVEGTTGKPYWKFINQNQSPGTTPTESVS